ncbi:RHS repeat-associated core domain-containing protein [Parvivirga hydrogeniphila]|uniref:RHS repeat-associated core domain-containing protein n=1 Tax=Parvivirga hydrogeniphila TaxID=2939460 RepID=UPI002260D23A|nr:RHS repeat-associated core domain-containing protein [Parvivirga hydrogeniphila]MDI6844275.1 RHS repeat-associated core domain-containing protein [Anaerosomatales bacterium]
MRYAGYVFDEHSGLYCLSKRYYDPATAQFLTKDPAKADGEESPYQYCGGDPVGKVDPSGLHSSAYGAHRHIDGYPDNSWWTEWRDGTSIKMVRVGSIRNSAGRWDLCRWARRQHMYIGVNPWTHLIVSKALILRLRGVSKALGRAAECAFDAYLIVKVGSEGRFGFQVYRISRWKRYGEVFRIRVS